MVPYEIATLIVFVVPRICPHRYGPIAGNSLLVDVPFCSTGTAKNAVHSGWINVLHWRRAEGCIDIRPIYIYCRVLLHPARRTWAVLARPRVVHPLRCVIPPSL